MPPARPIQDADAIQSRVRPGESTLEFWSATLREGVVSKEEYERLVVPVKAKKRKGERMEDN